MPRLPDRPDLDQLRRQARELLRAPVSGDPLEWQCGYRWAQSTVKTRGTDRISRITFPTINLIQANLGWCLNA
jgi:hypothetical protein